MTTVNGGLAEGLDIKRKQWPKHLFWGFGNALYTTLCSLVTGNQSPMIDKSAVNRHGDHITDKFGLILVPVATNNGHISSN